MGVKRFIFHVENLIRLAVPPPFTKNTIGRLARRLDSSQYEQIMERVNYYNQLHEPFPLDDSAITINRLSLRQSGSMYYYDFMESARYFPGSLRLHVVFGDDTSTQPVPTFIKTRLVDERPGTSPILRNSVLLKLDKFRHYQMHRDAIPFTAKRNSAVFRGPCFNAARQELVAKYRNHPLLDVADTSKNGGRRSPSFMTPRRHMRHKFIISVEGNDVATNLKWIMATNSVCMMRRPRIASWFMEDRLRPDYHYIALRDDFSDLPEKVEHYSRHTDEALAIINNAHAYIAQFMDSDRELLIAWLVMEKYFRLSGQSDVPRIFPYCSGD